MVMTTPSPRGYALLSTMTLGANDARVDNTPKDVLMKTLPIGLATGLLTQKRTGNPMVDMYKVLAAAGLIGAAFPLASYYTTREVKNYVNQHNPGTL